MASAAFISSVPSSEASSVSALASQECRQLAALKAKTFNELIALGSDLYTGHRDQLGILVSSIVSNTMTRPVEHRLAEALYFRRGHDLAMQYRIADMTRLQQEHEALALGIFAQGEIRQVNDFNLGLWLRNAMDPRNTERFVQMRHHGSAPT